MNVDTSLDVYMSVGIDTDVDSVLDAAMGTIVNPILAGSDRSCLVLVRSDAFRLSLPRYDGP
jgi:hypothetical protein